MEHLFTTDLIFAGKPASYNVDFREEAYYFKPTAGGPSFQLRRDHDEWHCEEPVDEVMLAQAIKALESYLLQQH